MSTKYVSIDIETTGLNPENCQVLEIGAVIADGTTPIEECPTFHCYVDHGLILGEPFAVSMHQTILRRIATHEEGYTYLQPWEVATRFRDFLKEHGLDSEDEKIVVAGKNYGRWGPALATALGNLPSDSATGWSGRSESRRIRLPTFPRRMLTRIAVASDAP